MKKDGINLPQGQEMRDVNEAGYKYLRALQTDKIMEKV